MSRTDQTHPGHRDDAEQDFRNQLERFRGTWSAKPRSERGIEIARLASEVLADEGLGRFSMRRVAERANMSLAALQYHFPSLAQLLEAMIAYRLDRYVDLAQGYLAGLSDDPEKAFRRHVSEFLDDAMSTTTARFTVQYEALAATDAFAATALETYMRLYRESLAMFLRLINPALDEKEAIRRGAALAGMIDGTMIVASADKPSAGELAGLKQTIESLAWQIATAPAGDLAPSR